MITTNNRPGEQICRSLSYNDLKKRRMLRSTTNQGKTNIIKDNNRYRHLEEHNPMKNVRMSDNLNYLPRLVSLAK
jgi:hypothetical protein